MMENRKMTSELIFLIFLVLKFTTVISKIGGKTRAVRKRFLHLFSITFHKSFLGQAPALGQG